jgi:hypothetical protein
MLILNSVFHPAMVRPLYMWRGGQPLSAVQKDAAVWRNREECGPGNRRESRRQVMAFKFKVGASLLMTACAALVGCQSAPPRNPNPGFTQRPGSTTPPVVSGDQQPVPPGAMGIPTNTAPSTGLGGIPSATPPTTGSQFRSTQQPLLPGNGPGSPGNGNSGTYPSPAPIGSYSGGPGFDTSSPPPGNPGFGNISPAARP